MTILVAEAAFGGPEFLILLILFLLEDKSGSSIDHEESMVHVEDVGFLDVVVHFLQLHDNCSIK